MQVWRERWARAGLGPGRARAWPRPAGLKMLKNLRFFNVLGGRMARGTRDDDDDDDDDDDEPGDD